MTTAASGPLLIRPHFQCFSRPMTLPAPETIHFSPCLPIYVTVSCFSDTQRHSPTHTVMAHTEPAPPIIYSCRHIPSNLVAIGTHKERMFRATMTEILTVNLDKTIIAILRKASVDKVRQIGRHAIVKYGDTKRLAHCWRKEIDMADKYGSYPARFLKRLPKLQHM